VKYWASPSLPRAIWMQQANPVSSRVTNLW